MLIHLLETRPIDATIWLVVTLLEWFAVLALYKGRAAADYPAFRFYLWFTAGLSVVRMALPTGHDFAIYSWFSFPAAVLQYLVNGAAIAELYKKTLGPKISLPDWVPRELTSWLAMAASLSAVLAITFHPQYGGEGLRIFMRIEETLIAGLALALAVLIFYTLAVRIPWWPRDAHIATGFVLMLFANTITLYLILAGPRRLAYPAQRVGDLMAMISFAWWSLKLWEKEPAPLELTDETFDVMLQFHRETLNARRIVDAQK
jgi:hypothetical protein